MAGPNSAIVALDQAKGRKSDEPSDEGEEHPDLVSRVEQLEARLKAIEEKIG